MVRRISSKLYGVLSDAPGFTEGWSMIQPQGAGVAYGGYSRWP